MVQEQIASGPFRMVETYTGPGGNAMRIFATEEGPREVVWAHGWGQSHDAFVPAIAGVLADAQHIAVDFPGFGGSPLPSRAWGTEDYADFVAGWLAARPRKPRVWIGHSFGCRVGIRIASKHPHLLDGMILIAAAGIPAPRSLYKQAVRVLRGYTFKTLKVLAPSESLRERLRDYFGSADYRRAGPLRDSFVKVVNENLTGLARQISLPVHLVYGAEDTETPVAVGRLFQKAMPNAQFTIVPHYGHLDILSSGRFQLQPIIRAFLRDLWK